MNFPPELWFEDVENEPDVSGGRPSWGMPLCHPTKAVANTAEYPTTAHTPALPSALPSSTGRDGPEPVPPPLRTQQEWSAPIGALAGRHHVTPAERFGSEEGKPVLLKVHFGRWAPDVLAIQREGAMK